MAELVPCPFCGGQPSAEVHAEGLHAEGGCERCGWTMEDWSGDLAKLIERMNTRPAPSTRMADVRLGAEAALEHTYPKMSWVPEFAARIAATVTLPAIQKNERSTDAFQCPSCGAAIKAPPRSNEKTLRRYGWHDESCPDYPTRTRPIGLCNCGFLSALASKESDRG